MRAWCSSGTSRQTEGDAALSLLNGFVADEIYLIAPSLLEYEVINGLVIAQRRGRIPQAAVIHAITAFQELDIRPRGVFRTWLQICLSYAGTYGRSVTMRHILLWRAERARADFITADKALYNAVHKDLVWVRLLTHRASTGDIPSYITDFLIGFRLHGKVRSCPTGKT